jgi:hypothetical protein
LFAFLICQKHDPSTLRLRSGQARSGLNINKHIIRTGSLIRCGSLFLRAAFFFVCRPRAAEALAKAQALLPPPKAMAAEERRRVFHPNFTAFQITYLL